MKRFLIQADEPNPRGKYAVGFIDHTGQVVIAPSFDAGQPFSDGRAAVRVDSKWGFIDETGKLVIEPKWQEVGAFSSGLASIVVAKREIAPEYREIQQCGYIDCAGDIRIEPTWVHSCGAFHEGRARIAPYDEKLGVDSKQWHFMDTSGARAFEGTFTHPGTDFHEGYALVPVSPEPAPMRMRLIDTRGRTVEPAAGWTPFGPFGNGVAPVAKVTEIASRPLTETGFIDVAGKLLFRVPGQVGEFRDERAIVRAADGTFGYVDVTGRVLTRGLREAEQFVDGFAFAVTAQGDAVILDIGARVLRKRERNEIRASGGLLYVRFYNRSISGGGPPPIMGYKNLAGKYVYLSQGIVEQKGEAWVRENYVGPASQSPLKTP